MLVTRAAKVLTMTAYPQWPLIRPVLHQGLFKLTVTQPRVAPERSKDTLV